MTNTNPTPLATTTSGNTNPAIYNPDPHGNQTLPPFIACDDLDAVIGELDDWVSNFIGRMVPYCHGLGTLRAQAEGAAEANAEKSGLENRIYASRLKIRSIISELDSMNESLRL